MTLFENRARQLLAMSGAIIEGHFVGTSGNHLSLYIAKDRATRLPSTASALCFRIAELFASDDVDVVVAPVIGGVALSQWTAHHLSRLRSDRPEVIAAYIEPEDRVIFEKKTEDSAKLSLGGNVVVTDIGDKIIWRKPSLALKRGFDSDVKGKNVLVVEDILTTGGSAKRSVLGVLNSGGRVVGVATLANGGGITATDLGVDRLEALLTIERRIFTEEECKNEGGLCYQGIPINTEFGHGKDFLARKHSA